MKSSTARGIPICRQLPVIAKSWIRSVAHTPWLAIQNMKPRVPRAKVASAMAVTKVVALFPITSPSRRYWVQRITRWSHLFPLLQFYELITTAGLSRRAIKTCDEPFRAMWCCCAMCLRKLSSVMLRPLRIQHW